MHKFSKDKLRKLKKINFLIQIIRAFVAQSSNA